MTKKARPLLMIGFVGTLVFGIQFGVDYGRAVGGPGHMVDASTYGSFLV